MMDSLDKQAPNAGLDIAFVKHTRSFCKKSGPFSKVIPLFVKKVPIYGIDDPHPSAVLDGIQIAVQNLFSNQHCLLPAEFPIEVLWVYYTSIYYGEVCNGGHNLLIDPMGYGPIPIRLCQSGFAAVELWGPASIVNRYVKIMGDPSSLDIVENSSQDKLRKLDSELFQYKYDDVAIPLANFARSLDCFEIFSNYDECKIRTLEMVRSHPDFVARRKHCEKGKPYRTAIGNMAY